MTQMAEAKKKTKNKQIWTSGRRKTAVARIRMEEGKGNVVINDLAMEEYLPNEVDQIDIFAPFKEVGRDEKGFDISIKTHGGGKRAQVGAIQLGLSKALVELDADLRKLLRKKGYLTRDPRMKERKKYNLHKARKAHQFSKR